MEAIPASDATPAVVFYRDKGDHCVFAAAMVAGKMTARIVVVRKVVLAAVVA